MNIILTAGAVAAAVAAVLGLAALLMHWLRRGLGLVDAIAANTAAVGNLSEKLDSFPLRPRSPA